MAVAKTDGQMSQPNPDDIVIFYSCVQNTLNKKRALSTVLAGALPKQNILWLCHRDQY